MLISCADVSDSALCVESIDLSSTGVSISKSIDAHYRDVCITGPLVQMDFFIAICSDCDSYGFPSSFASRVPSKIRETEKSRRVICITVSQPHEFDNNSRLDRN